MTTRVGMVTSTLDHGLSGPNRVLLNICEEINNREFNNFEFKYIHNEPSEMSIYTRKKEIIAPRTPLKFERYLAKLDLDRYTIHTFRNSDQGFFFLRQ